MKLTVSSFVLPLVATLFETAKGDDTYLSRKDLNVPQWNITRYGDVKPSEGYIFVTPYETTSSQPGAYIYDQDGDLVWSGFSYFGGTPFNFQVFNETQFYAWEGSVNIRTGHGHGHFSFFDNSYKPIKQLHALEHRLGDIHELTIPKNSSSALIEIFEPTDQYDLSPYGNGTWVNNAIIQDIDLETGELIFEWVSLDHISPAESVLSLESGLAGVGQNSSTAWDVFHFNSVDKNVEGDYLISARHSSTIYKVSGKTGEVLWRYSTSSSLSNFTIIDNSAELEVDPEYLKFGFQHHARFLTQTPRGGKEIIKFFDNHAYSHGHTEAGHGSESSSVTSSGKIVELDLTLGTAKVLEIFLPPTDHPLLAKSQGSLQLLQNHHAVINWGSAGSITEYDSHHNPIFHAALDADSDDVQNYRAFKYPRWVGYSPEKIALFKQGSKVYISWNGDTETKKWKLSTQGKEIGVFKRAKFETVIDLPLEFQDISTKSIEVQALSQDGEVLGSLNSAPKEEASPRVPLLGALEDGFQNYFSWRAARTHD
ncbi:Putative arylsulfotransferase [Komagataella phaffii CBS 7435]|uniref:Arylsulfotransferase n=2 Tax=Komagataella phaffii TaxID=460519 RepID=C4QWE1_KOMPG|nr:Hypothetical protein PAS_chr1-1_0198 [Komagataella phaffii GS115]AOA60572.1 GQ67_02777T0 [Komagataella phaffii]CAH2446234.1 Putative arylsulfotransferase [Komagataella phaffii CBS 7435]AOA65414.1 GQ68_02471T0 [Komagataella phaffii GS115]CAY67564.1 Hypothetical protein PAS_chr1-1_0198 [Komagataella phaffii GS115]CCA36660.1 Putative arylsulfotransferase [Komagataella phaffii CBS 7435]